MDRNRFRLLLSVVSLLFILSLACRQSGDILTPAEATQRAEATLAAQTGDVIVIAEGAVFAPGDKAVLTSEGHLVGLFSDPESKNAFTYATRGDEVTVTSSVDIDGVIWYKIESTAGNGWLPETNFVTE
jgi:hypothetical protein